MRRCSLMITSLAGGLLLGPAPARGQAHDHHEQAPTRPPADVGRVIFAISCSAGARARFERGMALLHSFWYEEAGKAFRAASAADPSCGMAQWGHAMSLIHQLWAPPDSTGLRVGLEDVRAARAGRLPTARERTYVEAMAAYFDYPAPAPGDSIKPSQRLEAYGAKMAELARRFPADDEAAIFDALAIIANAETGDTTFTASKRADSILLPLFRKHPNHPGIAHYIIHANDAPPLAPLALDAARRYARLAPAVPHAQHMPSHIFIRVGAWDETIASNRLATESGKAYQRREKMDGVWSHTLHTMDFLQYAYLQEGQDSAARRLRDEVLEVRKTVPPNPYTLAYFRALFPARQALELGDWASAAVLPVPTGPDSGLAWSAGLTRFARGLGAARSGDTAVARGELGALERIERHLAQKDDTSGARHIMMQRIAVSAWLALAAGDTVSAVKLATEAATKENAASETPLIPARELQGELLLALGRGAEARASFEAALRDNPDRARSLFGLARAAEAAGDRAAAREAYTRYLALMRHADGDRPEIAIARRQIAAR